MRAVAIPAVVFLLAGCATPQPALVIADTCATEAGIVSTLADLKSAGKLSPAQIAAVNADIAAVDPVCSAATPQTALTVAATTAAQDMLGILTGAK